MNSIDKIRKFYIDGPHHLSIKPDDFVISIGKTKSNSVYHVIESKVKEHTDHITYTIKVLKSDLITCLKRDKQDQDIIPVQWYKKEDKTRKF